MSNFWLLRFLVPGATVLLFVTILIAISIVQRLQARFLAYRAARRTADRIDPKFRMPVGGVGASR